MLILMKPDVRAEHAKAVVRAIEKLGFKAHEIPGERLAIGITGNTGPLDREPFLAMEGVADAIPVTKPYKLASKEFKGHRADVEIPRPGREPLVFGAGRFVVIAGPCAVESEEQTLRIARAVKAGGAQVLRGGAYKPRSSPYSFQGLGKAGLRILEKARAETGLPLVTEAVDVGCLEAVAETCDIIQIGARNMQNFTLLQEAGKTKKPILLKRGISATIDEWLMAAEYVLSQGNDRVMLCERGIRSYDPHSRNLLDLGAVAILKGLTDLPVVVDPSHGTGKKQLVSPMAQAGVACGAAAVMMDVHDRPAEALCDGPQAIQPEEFAALVARLRKIAGALGLKMEESA